VGEGRFAGARHNAQARIGVNADGAGVTSHAGTRLWADLTHCTSLTGA